MWASKSARKLQPSRLPRTCHHEAGARRHHSPHRHGAPHGELSQLSRRVLHLSLRQPHSKDGQLHGSQNLVQAAHAAAGVAAHQQHGCVRAPSAAAPGRHSCRLAGGGVERCHGGRCTAGAAGTQSGLVGVGQCSLQPAAQVGVLDAHLGQIAVDVLQLRLRREGRVGALGL